MGETQLAGRAPYLIAGAVAFLSLSALAGSAPFPATAALLTYPWTITVIAAVLGMAATGSGGIKHLAVLIPLATCAITYAIEWWHARSVVASLGWSSIPESDKQLIFEDAFEVMAPWLVGSAYAVLSALSAERLDSRRDCLRAGVWLLVIAAIDAALVLANDAWLTLANLWQSGTTLSGPWADSRILAIALAAVASVVGVVLIAFGWNTRVPRRIRSRFS